MKNMQITLISYYRKKWFNAKLKLFAIIRQKKNIQINRKKKKNKKIELQPWKNICTKELINISDYLYKISVKCRTICIIHNVK